MPSTLQRSLNRSLVVLGAALLLATPVVLVACGGDDDSASTPATSAAVDKVQIKNFLYDPEGVSVPIGTTITFTNTDNAPHTATSGDSPSPDGMFDTDVIKKGASDTIKLTKAGTFEYYCALHPFMKGTVTVK